MTVIGNLVPSGALVHVLPGIIGADSRFAVVYPEREFLPAHVRAFVEALVAWVPMMDLTKRGKPSADGAPQGVAGERTHRRPSTRERRSS